MSDYILEMKNIRKEFPGVMALDNVDFKVERASIHALCGENGAGKSTLMKVLSGLYPKSSYEGEIILNNAPVGFHHVKQSEEAGIAVIYQELALVKKMCVYENIFLGNEIGKGGRINKNQMIKSATECLHTVGLDINPMIKIEQLGIGQQQLVEIAKAISKNAKLLVLDEPTAALTESESEALLELIKGFRDTGITCIYISHKLNEVLSVADRVTVLRDGKTICTMEKNDCNEEKIISSMVGRDLTQRYPQAQRVRGKCVLEVEDYTVVSKEDNSPIVENISFQAYQGEVLGIAGLMGAGRSELAMSLFGVLGKRTGGSVKINGKPYESANPSEAIKSGIGYLSEDRKRYGLVLGMDVKDNICIAALDQLTKHFYIDNNRKIKSAQNYVDDIKIKTPSLEQKAKNLSGGNQQKVVLAKWMMTNPQVLILDEPTRGIDVGAKYEIYKIMNQLVANGMAIIMISSELPEVLGMSDRILVMCEGKIRGEIATSNATQEEIIRYATGRL